MVVGKMPDLEMDRAVLAMIEVQQYAKTKLYHTEPPPYNIEAHVITTSGDVTEEWTIFLGTNLPDGMIYTVTWKGLDDKNHEFTAYKQLEEDMTPR